MNETMFVLTLFSHSLTLIEIFMRHLLENSEAKLQHSKHCIFHNGMLLLTRAVIFGGFPTHENLVANSVVGDG